MTPARDGYRSPASDVLNATERDFLPLTEVTVEPFDGCAVASSFEFLAVHRGHIASVAPVGPRATLDAGFDSVT